MSGDGGRPTSTTQSGDIINQDVRDNAMAVGKVVGGGEADLREAVTALQDLLDHLRQEGKIDEAGTILDEEAVREETERRSGFFRQLLGPVGRATGRKMVESVSDPAATRVVDTIIDLAG